MKPRIFKAHDGARSVEQFDWANGTGERFEVGAASPVRDATVMLDSDAWLEKLIDGAQRAKSTPAQKCAWLRLAEIALDKASPTPVGQGGRMIWLITCGLVIIYAAGWLHGYSEGRGD